MSNEDVLLNKVLDASSNTIWDELKKIRESSETEKKTIRRRWIWELIQNASDCTPKGKKIDIKIDYSNNQIIFSHNGLPFSYENLLDLITQISSKQSSEEKKTGKFGTGFMSTHLLSEIVQIEGSFIQKNSKYTKLKFNVDRSGNDYSDIKNKTKTMLEQLNLVSRNQEELQEKYE
ncbi:ATP-binding protein, partial [Bacillus cereus]|uniref:ATP-binding protein n=3 Tax=Bacillus TaxID=1386 RepID=UPI002B24950B